MLYRTKILLQSAQEIRALVTEQEEPHRQFRVTILNSGNHCQCKKTVDCCAHARAARDAVGLVGDLGLPRWRLGEVVALAEDRTQRGVLCAISDGQVTIRMPYRYLTVRADAIMSLSDVEHAAQSVAA